MKNLFYFLPLLFIACSSQEVEFEKSTGTINKVKANSRFFINLSESHKVGSGLWAVDNNNYDRKVVNYLGSAYKSEDGGSVNFNFEALEKGKTEINLVQSFAGDTLQTSTFVVEVE
ncbi:MAG: hypothetical protein Q8M29_13045 [Bacteroidota bacterium]|nr:hypothetical protein [Bacteroidota bacterium]